MIIATVQSFRVGNVADRNVYQIVHLIYRSKNYEVQSKDYEFSRLSMQDHWRAGRVRAGRFNAAKRLLICWPRSAS